MTDYRLVDYRKNIVVDLDLFREIRMTPEQDRHLADIQSKAISLINYKYRKGQQEHGGNLFDMNTVELVDNAINEAIDEVVYLLTLKDRLMEQRGVKMP
jgi:hypothetical protein